MSALQQEWLALQAQHSEQRLQAGGVHFLFDTTVTRLVPDGDRIAAVETAQGGLMADAFVLALGSASFVVGASGGIFGLFAALFVINRGFGGNNVSLVVIIGINLALGFILPGIAWEAHVGGLAAGFVVTTILQRLRR